MDIPRVLWSLVQIEETTDSAIHMKSTLQKFLYLSKYKLNLDVVWGQTQHTRALKDTFLKVNTICIQPIPKTIGKDDITAKNDLFHHKSSGNRVAYNWAEHPTLLTFGS